MRTLTTICCAVALIALAGCGGSSYLSEFPGEGGELSVIEFSAEAAVAPENTSSSKDVVLSPVTGETGGSGDAFVDGGDHMCKFDVSPLSSPGGLVEVVISPASCVDANNCAVCDVTDSVLGGGTPEERTCTIDCYVVAEAQEAFSENGEKILATMTDYILFYSDAIGSSGGAVRVDAASAEGSVFDMTAVEFVEQLPSTEAGADPCTGIVISEDLVGDQACTLWTPKALPAQELDVTGTDEAGDFHTRKYSIEDMQADDNYPEELALLLDGLFTDLIDAPISSDVHAVGGVEIMIPLEFDISGLSVPGDSIIIPTDTATVAAGMWHEAGNNKSTILGVPD